MISFVYAFHYLLTDTISELDTPTVKRTAAVNASTIFILFGCYLPVAISGYLLKSGAGISSNVLAGMADESVVVIIAKWVISALLFITYALFIIPLRRKFERIFFGNPSSPTFSPASLTVTACLSIFVAIVSASLPDLGFANTLAGGCIAVIMFIFPGMLMIRMQLDKPPARRKRLELITGAVFTVLGALVCFVGLFGALILGEI